MKNSKKQNLQSLALILILLIAINSLSFYFFKRFDLTEDKRYTLSETSLNIIKNVDSPLIVDVFLCLINFSRFNR